MAVIIGAGVYYVMDDDVIVNAALQEVMKVEGGSVNNVANHLASHRGGVTARAMRQEKTLQRQHQEKVASVLPPREREQGDGMSLLDASLEEETALNADDSPGVFADAAYDEPVNYDGADIGPDPEEHLLTALAGESDAGISAGISAGKFASADNFPGVFADAAYDEPVNYDAGFGPDPEDHLLTPSVAESDVDILSMGGFLSADISPGVFADDDYH